MPVSDAGGRLLRRPPDPGGIIGAYVHDQHVGYGIQAYGHWSGGIIPGEDMTKLEKVGYAKLFGPGTTTDSIAKYIQEEMARRWAAEGARR